MLKKPSLQWLKKWKKSINYSIIIFNSYKVKEEANAKIAIDDKESKGGKKCC